MRTDFAESCANDARSLYRYLPIRLFEKLSHFITRPTGF